MRITINLYTQNYPPFVALNATLGYVYGVIGAPSPDDTLWKQIHVPYWANVTYDDPTDDCYGQDLADYPKWSEEASFEVDETNMKLHVDLSNSIPTDIYNNICNIGTLRLGIRITNCISLLGDDSGIPMITFLLLAPFIPSILLQL